MTKRKLEKSLEELKIAAAKKKEVEFAAEMEQKRMLESFDAEKRLLGEALERMRVESSKGWEAVEEERGRNLEESKMKDSVVGRLEEEKKVLLEEIQVAAEKEKVLEVAAK